MGLKHQVRILKSVVAIQVDVSFDDGFVVSFDDGFVLVSFDDE